MTLDSVVLVAIVSAFCFAVAEMFTRNALRFSTPITASILSIAGQFILLTILMSFVSIMAKNGQCHISDTKS